MNLSQTLKALIVGFLFGVVLVWILALIIPLTMNVNPTKFIRDCYDDIYSMSIFAGGISCVIWPLLAARRHKQIKEEERQAEQERTNELMREYLEKKLREGNDEKS